MVTTCWAVKGGSGTTVVAATLALESSRPTLLVDLDGDVGAVLGLDPHDRPGVADWLAGDGPTHQLDDLVIDLDDTTGILPCRAESGSHTAADSAGDPAADIARFATLVEWCCNWERERDGDVIIDAGTAPPATSLSTDVEHRWLVTRPCYLSLRRAARSPVRPTGVVLVAEPGRQLRPRDVERSVGAPIVATVEVDPRVARAVDSGLLRSRPPATLRRSLRQVSR